MARDGNTCWRMLTSVKSRVQRDIATSLYETNDIVAAALTYANEYIARWEFQNSNKDFLFGTIICD